MRLSACFILNHMIITNYEHDFITVDEVGDKSEPKKRNFGHVIVLYSANISWVVC